MSAARPVSFRLSPETRVALRKFRAYIEGKTERRITVDTALRFLLVLAREAKKEGLLDRVLMRYLGVNASA